VSVGALTSDFEFVPKETKIRAASIAPDPATIASSMPSAIAEYRAGRTKLNLYNPLGSGIGENTKPFSHARTMIFLTSRTNNPGI
jgi:hypothetical protein